MIPPTLGLAVAAAEEASLEGAVDAIRPFLADIGWFHGMIRSQLPLMAADPLHLPSLRASRSGDVRHLVIARTERVWITATVLDPFAAPLAQVHFSGRFTITRSLRGSLDGHLYRLESGRAVDQGVCTWQEGALIELDESRASISFSPSSGRRVLLRAQIAPVGPVHAQVHDRASGDRIGEAQADEGHARTLMMLSLLRLQGRQDATCYFEQALDAPLGRQRWAAMREFLALDTSAALPALTAMATREPEPEVRALACRTLSQVRASPCPA